MTKSVGPFLGLISALFLCDLPIAAQRTIRPANRVTAAIDDRFTVARPADRHPLARRERGLVAQCSAIRAWRQDTQDQWRVG